jgi:hypothetical protein
VSFSGARAGMKDEVDTIKKKISDFGVMWPKRKLSHVRNFWWVAETATSIKCDKFSFLDDDPLFIFPLF